MNDPFFTDRVQAGKLLAEALFEYRRVPGLLVLGLPRGGVPVAYEIAVALGSELDVIVVRKLGVPSQPELALGAIASGGVIVLNSEVVGFMEITDEQIRSVRAAEQQELMRREHQYRGNKPLWEAADRTVIIVDDGLATGASMKAAVAAVAAHKPREIVVAVPIAPAETCAEMKKIANRVVCLRTPDPFYAVGYWYRDFRQTSDREVQSLLEQVHKAIPSMEK